MKNEPTIRLKREPKSRKKHGKQVLKFDKKSMENMTASESGEPCFVPYFTRSPLQKKRENLLKINEQTN